jgi:D-alanyl-D-alanine carboxypeptidase
MLARIRSAPHDAPGTAWGYSNSAFYLAGLLVERVTGKGYWDFLAQAFFEPLGMPVARPCARVPVTARAHGYRLTKAGLEDAETESWENPYAGGGLCMTAGDLLAWQAALDRGRALAPESVRRMRTPTKLASGNALDYGLGTRLGELGHPVLGHTGGGQASPSSSARRTSSTSVLGEGRSDLASREHVGGLFDSPRAASAPDFGVRFGASSPCPSS